MSCLKCGRDTETDQVFCHICLEDMENYPVKPGTVVRLPIRPEPSAFRKLPKRRPPSAEEQIRTLKQRLQVLLISLLIALLVICALAVPAYEHLFGERLLPGQNYSTILPSYTDSTVLPK